MAFELLTEVPSLLREGHVVRFTEKWDKAWAKKYFRILIAQQIEYDVHRIVAPGTGSSSYQDISFDSPAGGGVSAAYLSLLPENPETIYEILIGFKGLCLAYPRYNNSYALKLETTQVLPDLTDDSLRFIGFYDEVHSPYYALKLREHTVKDQSPPELRLFNPMVNDEKFVMRFIVNRCKVEEVAVAALTEQEKRVAREIKHFSVFTW